MSCQYLPTTSKRHFVILFLLYAAVVFLGGTMFIWLEGECSPMHGKGYNKPVDYFNFSHSLCQELLIFEKDLKEANSKVNIPSKLTHLITKCESIDHHTRSNSLQEPRNMTSQHHFHEDERRNDSAEVPGECRIWTFGNLVKWATFCSSTIFTIGYGDVVVKTLHGRIAIIIYALIGMTIALSLLAVAGQIVIHYLSMVIDLFEKRCLGRKTPAHDYLKVFFAALFSFALSIACGCLITTSEHLDNLSWEDSIHYWFQTITTIGWGDIQFDRSIYHGWKSLIYFPYILCVILGLALMAALLNLASTIVITGEWRRFCCCIPSGVTETDNVMKNTAAEIFSKQKDDVEVFDIVVNCHHVDSDIFSKLSDDNLPCEKASFHMSDVQHVEQIVDDESQPTSHVDVQTNAHAQDIHQVGLDVRRKSSTMRQRYVNDVETNVCIAS